MLVVCITVYLMQNTHRECSTTIRYELSRISFSVSSTERPTHNPRQRREMYVFITLNIYRFLFQPFRTFSKNFEMKKAFSKNSCCNHMLKDPSQPHRKEAKRSEAARSFMFSGDSQ